MRGAIRRAIRRGVAEVGSPTASVPAYQALLDLNPVLLVPSINDAYAEGRLWQDAAMTTPATTVDDPVGAVEDFSGNSYHLTASGTARPLLKQDGGGNWYLDCTSATVIMDATIGAAWTDPVHFFAAGATGGNDSPQGFMAMNITGDARARRSLAGEMTATLVNDLHFRAERISIDPSVKRVYEAVTESSVGGVGKAGLAYNNNALYLSGDDIINATTGDFKLAVGHTGTSLGGALYSAVVFNRILPDAERLTVNSYLASQSGVTL